MNLFEQTIQELSEEKISPNELKKRLEKSNIKMRKDVTPRATRVDVESTVEGETRHSAAIRFASDNEIVWGQDQEVTKVVSDRPIVNLWGWTINFKPQPGERSTTASDMEEAICALWNDRNGFEHNYKVKKGLEERAEKVVSQMMKDRSLKKEKAIHTGPMKVGVISDYWRKNISGKIDTTPKTDIIIGDKKISVKMGSASQLCSGKAVDGEGKALTLWAIDHSDVKKEIREKVEDFFDTDKTSLAASSKDVENKGEKAVRKAHKELSEILSDLISKNKDFQEAFLREALTGEAKFGSINEKKGSISSNEAIADYILVGNEDGTSVYLKEINDNYVESIKGKIRIYVALKSADGRKWSAIRSEYKHPNERKNEDLNESLKDIWQIISNFFINALEELKKGFRSFLKVVGYEVKTKFNNNIEF